ncbi:MAG: alpha/beta fold hydrolase [Azonexus sp.]|jgi:predicted alpha/beta hydrolase|nr:alpha/beta fold hydrolase [Azonexus sp.]
MTIQSSRITTQNGRSVHASFFQPKQEAKAAVLVVPAMGIRQDYYAPFAAWLSNQGYLVATFDYSGTGLSRDGDIRRLRVNIFDWAQCDCDAMIDAVQARVPSRPIYWLGHSLGGQILGLVPNWNRVSKAVTIATGSGYWIENTPDLKWKVWWLWFVVAPLMTRACGYFPGKRLRKVGDLPRGVMDQWRQWCLNPDYVVGAEGQAVREKFAAVSVPITSFSFTDDEMMSARNTESMHGFYTTAPKTMKRIAPQDIGAERIGHFGFFRSRFEDSLWRHQLLPELS